MFYIIQKLQTLKKRLCPVDTRYDIMSLLALGFIVYSFCRHPIKGEPVMADKTNISKRKLLGVRLTVTLVLSSLFIGIVMAVFLANLYQNRIDSEYKSKVAATANVVAHMIDSETVDRYLSTLEKDAEYERILENLRVLGREFDIEYIVISTFTEEHEIFVFDTDEVEGSQIDLGNYLINSESKP